ncbi:MAG: hypothetical protein KKC75_02605 [Nanoarchaeota archaeon]|nr:hypothetical protein [Nanoarchaeota archaeon]MBU1945848.1 hypothetical protein [Nanoarchaeota archaeon]
MELISKVSKGSVMDQIYLPKKRMGFEAGTYVAIRPLQETAKVDAMPIFYNIEYLEPVKVAITKEIFGLIDKNTSDYDNVIITGSFIESGFNFNDIDVLLISEEKIKSEQLGELIEKNTGIPAHVIAMDNKTLMKGISTDPLYRTMLSKCVSIKRFVYNAKPEINYKILDVHLLKSKLLIENFDFLTGKEKYEMVRNAVAIARFIEGKEVSKSKVDENIRLLFGKEMDERLEENMITDKKDFIEKYNKFYKTLSSKILEGVKNDSKQE